MSNGHRRNAAIEEYHLLDQPPRDELSALAELAARVCGAPTALITVLSDAGPSVVGSFGFDERQEASACGLCTEALLDHGSFVVSDTADDDTVPAPAELFGDSGVVRFSAGHPLTTPDGLRFGLLCVFDEVPHAIDRQADDLGLVADRVVGVFELELASRRLFEAHDALAVAQDGLADFAGIVSHDLKNPLAAVAMSLEIAQDNIDPADTLLSAMVARAERGAQRMKDMIDDLHSFARQGTAPEKRDVAVADLLEVALGSLPPSFDRSAVAVGAMPTVAADPDQYQVVFSNLLDNAARFVHSERPPAITVTATEDADLWAFAVVDNGVGIPEDARLRVFEPLARLDKSVAGTGLGLTTARRIVKAHRGRIWIEETPGGGTTVRFTLPRP